MRHTDKARTTEEESQDHSVKALVRDDRGSITVGGIAAGAIGAGALFYLAGIGESIVTAQALENAADSASFTGAVTSARGFNVAGLLNASTLAIGVVLTALKSVEAVVTGAFMMSSSLLARYLSCNCESRTASCGTWCFAEPTKWYTPLLSSAQGTVSSAITAVTPCVNGSTQAIAQILRLLQLDLLSVIAGLVFDMIANFVNVAVGWIHQFIPRFPFEFSPCAIFQDMVADLGPRLEAPNSWLGIWQPALEVLGWFGGKIATYIRGFVEAFFNAVTNVIPSLACKLWNGSECLNQRSLMRGECDPDGDAEKVSLGLPIPLFASRDYPMLDDMSCTGVSQAAPNRMDVGQHQSDLTNGEWTADFDLPRLCAADLIPGFPAQFAPALCLE